MTETNKEDFVSLKRMSYIYYLLRFWKGTARVWALIDSSSKVNAMTPAYVSKLGLKVYFTNIGAQKIDGSILETFGMILANF